MSSFSDSTPELPMYLAYSLFFFYAGLVIFRAVRSWAEEFQEDKLAPVKLSASRSALRFINPARSRGRNRSVSGQASVRQAYPILRRGAGKFLVKVLVRGGAFGIRHPFRTYTVHYDVIWYQYVVNGVTLWGKSQFPFGFETLEQATSVAEVLIGKTIAIRYNPDIPEDSEPVFPPIKQMLNL